MPRERAPRPPRAGRPKRRSEHPYGGTPNKETRNLELDPNSFLNVVGGFLSASYNLLMQRLERLREPPTSGPGGLTLARAWLGPDRSAEAARGESWFGMSLVYESQAVRQ